MTLCSLCFFPLLLLLFGFSGEAGEFFFEGYMVDNTP